jgi:hypothetical protein
MKIDVFKDMNAASAPSERQIDAGERKCGSRLP